MGNNNIKTLRLTGKDILGYLPEVAKLRIAVFREYPYLYDGDFEYEKKYLKTYAASLGSVIIAAFKGNDLVGASTGIPMSDADAAVQTAFLSRGHNIERWFYHGESVLLPSYRGHGIGVKFFQEREAHARDLGCTNAAFCGVVRPDDHPQKPQGYIPLDDFWRHRGYKPMIGMQCNFSWKEIGAIAEKEFPMSFWYKELHNE